MLNIVLFGAPGAGKGTQAELLMQEFGLLHLSTGEMLREEIAKGTGAGMKAKAIEQGNFAPDDVVIELLTKKIEDNRNAKGFVFDGFPRTTAQAAILDSILASIGSSVDMLVSLEVDQDILTERLLKRGVEENRLDDSDISIIRKRIGIYHERTEVVMDYYKRAGKFYPISGEGTLNEILNRIKEKVNIATAR